VAVHESASKAWSLQLESDRARLVSDSDRAEVVARLAAGGAVPWTVEDEKALIATRAARMARVKRAEEVRGRGRAVEECALVEVRAQEGGPRSQRSSWARGTSRGKCSP
jgi:hypothetical protein